MARTITVEIDKHMDGRWTTYNTRTVPGKGSNAKGAAVKVARELAKTTMYRMGVRVRVIDTDGDMTLWRESYARPFIQARHG